MTVPELARTLGVRDSVLIGLGSMIGAGIFATLAPAAQAAGTALPLALAVAGVVAYCNATSSARLAARYPSSGGTYVYGRERLGEFWGYLAGWGFVIGKTASCAAIALTVGAYAWPEHAHAVAVASVLALTAVNYVGVQKSALLTRALVAVVLTVLAVVVVVGLGSAEPSRWADGGAGGALGVLQAAGLLFFAFAGYARIATLGEEVRDPRRTIGLAIPVALGITLVVYTLVAAAALKTLGPHGLATAADPLAQVVRAAGAPELEPLVRVGAVLAALGSLLALILGVSRTTLAMARDGHLPRGLAAVHPRFGVPHRAELLVGAVVAVLAAVADLRHAIGFSSFAVLAYYLIANCAALTLTREEGRAWPGIPILGALGCVTLGFALPVASVLGGLAVLGAGALVYVARRRGTAS
ncbi:APC family permease [Rhodococcus maanshanensis]|uniref:Basic amino acid/polyamine antiporter, APA family n=1 Tax=Rhodococcus maanshanensis TaxID=183556 RepID=A0A1H7UT60_9NOCA|nr:amino acid permease [Rhodococcus maanshanensis]SEM00014.1 basic amino acid/polyamine antiporter, APA family [Rhodococcus maanshanensis]